MVNFKICLVKLNLQPSFSLISISFAQQVYFLFLQKIFLKIFNSIHAYTETEKTFVTIGSFDGVHLGHQKIIHKLVGEAATANCKSLILTFFPHPKTFFTPNVLDIKLINTIEERIELLQKQKLDSLVIQEFNQEFSNLSPEQFVKEILVEKFNVAKIFVGYDHKFGKNRAGNFETLVTLSEKYNFEVEQLEAKDVNSNVVSSTKIRQAILNGTIPEANHYLGYPFFITGTVTQGNQIGRTIGFPTANIQLKEDYKLIPKNGVYIVQGIINNKKVNGILNIGNRPTINGTNQTIEAHFFDFNKDIYNQEIIISFLDFIRPEQKFNSLEELKQQIEKDKQTALLFFNKN